MLRKIAVIGLLILISVSLGCINESEKTLRLYVCPTGQTVSDAALCPTVSPPPTQSAVTQNQECFHDFLYLESEGKTKLVTVCDNLDISLKLIEDDINTYTKLTKRVNLPFCKDFGIVYTEGNYVLLYTSSLYDVANDILLEDVPPSENPFTRYRLIFDSQNEQGYDVARFESNDDLKKYGINITKYKSYRYSIKDSMPCNETTIPLLKRALHSGV